MTDPPHCRCLSVRQPWANLIAAGIKTLETRTWPTPYRGPLLIASSRTPPIAPAGYIIASCRLFDCRPMVLDDDLAACCELYEGAWAWVLTDIVPVVPVPVRGRLGIYTLTPPPQLVPLTGPDLDKLKLAAVQDR